MDGRVEVRPVIGRRVTATLVALALVAAGVVLGAAPSRAADAGTVSGTVRLAGAPAAAAAVSVTLRHYSYEYSGDHTDRQAATDASGTYRFDGVTAGFYDLYFDYLPGDAYADTWSTGGGGPRYTGRIQVGPEGRVVDVNLARGAAISGIVRDGAGRAVVGATVTAQFVPASGSVEFIPRTTVSGPGGAYRLSGLVAGTFSLGFSHPSFPFQGRGQDPLAGIPDRVTTLAGLTALRTDMTMYRATTVAVTLTCWVCQRYLSPDDYWVEIQRKVVGPRGIVSWQWAATAGAVYPYDSAWILDYSVGSSLVPGQYRAVARSTGWSGPSIHASSATVTIADGGSARLTMDMTRTPVNRDLNGDGRSDVGARASDGFFHIFQGNGKGGFAVNAPIYGGWGPYLSVFELNDFDSDGRNDLMARATDGSLYFFARDVRGWLPRRLIGTGWQRFTAVFSPGDVDRDGAVDILARDTDGTLYLYSGTGYGELQARRVVGTGWGSYTALFSPGDFDGDGQIDLLARAANGTLFLYPGDGGGGMLPPRAIGAGWQSFTALFPAGDFTGDGHPDVFARAANGALFLYPGNGSGGFLAKKQVGSGWQGFRVFD